jgi:AcrR family transcriptional regulator
MPETTPESSPARTAPPISSRDRILYSAKTLFARNGYENTSTVAIAREAGTSESQLMKHFGSKQGLLAAIFDRGWSGIIERVQALPSDVSATERLVGLLEGLVIELENDPELKELAALEARRVRKDNRDVLVSRGYRQFTDLMDTLLSEIRSQGGIRSDVNLHAVRCALMGMAEGMMREQVVAKRSECLADYSFDDIRKVLEILVSATTGEAAQPRRAVGQ